MATINTRFENLTLERLQDIYDLVLAVPTSTTWGSITGTLALQTDLQTALNGKFSNPTGTVSQYIRGDGTLASFPSLGLTVGTTAIANGAVNRILFQGTGNVLQESLKFTFDEVTNNNTRLLMKHGLSQASIIDFSATDTTYSGGFLATGPTFSYGTYAANSANLIGGSGGVAIRINSSSNFAIHGVNASVDNATKQFQVFGATGNVLIQNGGTFTDAGFKLDVNGTARVQGDFTAGLLGAAITSFKFYAGTSYGGQGNVTITGQGAGGLYLGIGGGSSATSGNNLVLCRTYLNEYNNTVYGFVGLDNTLPMTFRFGALGSSVESMRLSTTNVILSPNSGNNVLIGTTTDAGFKVDINGTARIATNLTVGSGPNTTGNVLIGRALAIGYIVSATASSPQSFILGGTGNTLNLNSFVITSGGYANTLGNVGVCRYVLAAAPTSVGANSVTNLYVLGTETLKLNDGTSSGVNSLYNAGIITVDLTVMEVSLSGNSNVYVGKFVFRFKRYLINNVGFFTNISAVTNLYNSADATLVGTTLQAVANGTNALDLTVTLPATANTANYRMGANVTITKVNNA